MTRDLKSEYQPSNALIEHFATLERDRLNHVGGQDVAIKLEPQQDRRPPSTLPLMTHIGVSDLCDGDPQNVVVKTEPDATNSSSEWTYNNKGILRL